MTLVRVQDGLAYVTYDNEECFDCCELPAEGLTVEEAVIAAEHLLQLAGRAWTGLRDVSPPQLLTDEQLDAVNGVIEAAEWLARTEQRGPVMIPGFASPFGGIFGEVVFELKEQS